MFPYALKTFLAAALVAGASLAGTGSAKAWYYAYPSSPPVVYVEPDPSPAIAASFFGLDAGLAIAGASQPEYVPYPAYASYWHGCDYWRCW